MTRFRVKSVAIGVLACGFWGAPSLRAAELEGDAAGALGLLAQLRRDVVAAPGPAAYVVLRKIWSEWDRGDANAVEETLHEVADDARLPAPTRAYAGLLEAYA